MKSEYHHKESVVSWHFGETEGYYFTCTDHQRVVVPDERQGVNQQITQRFHVLVKPLTAGMRPIGEDYKPLVSGDTLVLHSIPLLSPDNEGECNAYLYPSGKKRYQWKMIPSTSAFYERMDLDQKQLGLYKVWLLSQREAHDVVYCYGEKANTISIYKQWQGLPTLHFTGGDYASGGCFNYINNDSFGESYDLPKEFVDDSELATLDLDNDPAHSKFYTLEGVADYHLGCFRTIESTIVKNGKRIKIKRTYGIVYDKNHRFYAFCTSSRNKGVDLKTANLRKGLISQYQFSDLDWPSEINPSLLGDSINEQYQMNWYFRYDGNYAVAIAKVFDDPWTENGIRSEHIDEHGRRTVLRESSNYLIEIELSIDITGEGPNDFTFKTPIARTLDPKVNGRCIVAADYACRDFIDHDVKRGDLLLLEYEYYLGDMVLDTPKLYTYRILQQNSLGIGSTYPLFLKINGSYNYFDNQPIDPHSPYNREYLLSTLSESLYRTETKMTMVPYITPSGIIIFYPVYEAIPTHYTPTKIDGIDASQIIIPESKYLVSPNRYTLAKVKNVKNSLDLDGATIDSWVAHYQSTAYHKYKFSKITVQSLIFGHVNFTYYKQKIKNSGIEFKDWFTMEALANENQEADVQKQAIFYSANLQSLELKTLTWLLAFTLRVEGMRHTGDFGGIPLKIREESISGVQQKLFAFGAVKQIQYEGYPSIIEAFINELNTNKKPNGDYTLINLTTVVNSDEIHPRIVTVQEISPVEYYGDMTHFWSMKKDWYDGLDGLPLYLDNFKNNLFVRSNVQKLTLSTNGIETVHERVFNSANVIWSSHYKSAHVDYLGLTLVDTETSKSVVITPRIYSFFDHALSIDRPGRITQTATLNSPSTPASYTNRTSTLSFTESGKLGFHGYPLGKIVASRVMSLTLNGLHNTKDQVRTHPNGSFAVCTLPMITFTDKHISVLTEDEITKERTMIEFEGMGTVPTKQLALDKIYYRYEWGDYAEFFVDVETTHLEMFNLAFNKTLEKTNYEYELTQIPTAYSLINNNADTAFYDGGLKIVTKNNHEDYDEDIKLLPEGVYHRQRFDTSKVIGTLDYEYHIPRSFRWRPHETIAALDGTLLHKTYPTKFSFSDYSPTLRLESGWLVLNPYVVGSE